MDEEEEIIRRLSIQNFYSTFPDEESCLRMFPTICNDCGPTTPVEIEIERSFHCSLCGKLCWRTANTFFAGYRKVLPGFLLTWLIEDQVKISTAAFARAAGVAFSTAWNLDQRIREVCHDEMLESNSLFGVITTAFNPVIFRRSKLTPANEHPVAEGVSEVSLQPDVQVFETKEEQAIFENLSDEPQLLEVIAEKAGLNPFVASIFLTKMEILKDVVTRLPGDKFSIKRAQNISVADLDGVQLSAISDFFEFLKHFGTSRRYLQLAVAKFWATTNKVKWRATSLFNTCMQSPKLRRMHRDSSVTPFLITMAVA